MNATKSYTKVAEYYNAKAIMIVLLIGSFISLFNETILNVAFPTLMVEMHITATTAQWLTTGYVLVVGILVPITAFLIHTFTTKQLFLSAMTLFLVGTILAIFSTSFAALLISRLIQASGTGMLIPIMMNTALVVNPPEKRGSAVAICISVITLGPALAPVVAGLLLQLFSWHALFIILIPLLIACMVFGYIFLENTSVITKPKIDYLSILLSTIGFAGVIYAISAFGTISTFNMLIVFAIGLIALILFGKRQLLLKEPMLELKSFKYPVFTIGMILIVLMQMLLFPLGMIIPLLLQNGLKTSTFVSALALLPGILCITIVTPFVGKIYDKIGGKTLIPSGLAIICIFTLILSRITPSTSIATIAVLYCFICIGISMSMSPSQTNALNELSYKNQADGVAIENTVRQIAGALGSALFLGIMTAYQNSYLNNVGNQSNSQDQVKAIYNGFGHSLSIAAIIIAIGFILTLLLSRDHKSVTKESQVKS
ncbi:DHA2 family efflux MFS transporter permease subunit [Clostridium algoriphilum]|uniref:MDR family MFS transporter n=1 Tax=Clostridium algoriphilum TaxID=198347 RepID=UPI001CF56D60|nr:MDR family MFS transporter [Clostridium algoriphilum]MCB2294095.1 DHA2 family efflux MFS transporter permease subunit [Clostridium algoriphilum]